MALRLNGSSSGYVELDVPAAAGSHTLTLPDGGGSSGQYLQTNGSGGLSWATVSASNLTRGTEVNSNSGTAIDFTNIPSGVKRITLTFNQVSTNGTEYMMVQIGDSGGFETSGYFSISGQTFSANGNPHESSIGFTTAWGSTAGNRTGSFFLHNPSGNRWVFSGMHCAFDGVNKGVVMTGGVKSLSGELDRVRITQTGSNTFDNGTIGIFYED
jgi:hypothetical protein